MDTVASIAVVILNTRRLLPDQSIFSHTISHHSRDRARHVSYENQGELRVTLKRNSLNRKLPGGSRAAKTWPHWALKTMPERQRGIHGLKDAPAVYSSVVHLSDIC